MTEKTNKGGLHMTTERSELAIQEINAAIATEKAKLQRYLNKPTKYATGYKSKYSGTIS